jgi:hypothetical protein
MVGPYPWMTRMAVIALCEISSKSLHCAELFRLFAKVKVALSNDYEVIVRSWFLTSGVWTNKPSLSQKATTSCLNSIY